MITRYRAVLRVSVLTIKFLPKTQTRGLDEMGQWGDTMMLQILGSMCHYEVLTRGCFVCSKIHVSLIWRKQTRLVYPFVILLLVNIA